MVVGQPIFPQMGKEIPLRDGGPGAGLQPPASPVINFPDYGKKFEDRKAYIIDLSGNVLMEEQDRGVETPYRLSFHRVKNILGVKE